MIFVPDLAMLPWIHLFTVALLWLKWRLTYPSAAELARTNTNITAGGERLASVDKGALFSSDSDGSSGADSDDEVYYAVPKPLRLYSPDLESIGSTLTILF